MEELFATNGIELKKIAAEARENNREDVAKAIEEKIADFQRVYDFFGARCTTCPDEPLWAVDAEALKNW